MKEKNQTNEIKKTKKLGKRERRKQLLDSIRPLVPNDSDKPMSEDDLIIYICESFPQSYKMTNDQYKRASELGEKLNRTVGNIASTYIDYGIKTLETKADRLKEKIKKTKKADRKYLVSAGSAQFKIKDVVQKMIDKNNKTNDPDEKVFISQTILAQKTGCNRPAVKSFLESQKELLDKHHAKHNLDENHNRSVKMRKNKLKRIEIEEKEGTNAK